MTGAGVPLNDNIVTVTIYIYTLSHSQHPREALCSELTSRREEDATIVVTGLRFSGFSGLWVLELFVRFSGRASGLIY